MKVFIIAAVTIDGFIGLDAHQNSTTWTTKADLAFFVRRTKQAGTVVMGRRTFEVMNRPLKDRRTVVLSSAASPQPMEGVEYTDEPLPKLVERLAAEGVTELAVCGGASVYTQFMQQGLVDELYISVMPTVFGQGIPLFGESISAHLTLLDSEKLDDNTMMLHYKVTPQPGT